MALLLLLLPPQIIERGNTHVVCENQYKVGGAHTMSSLPVDVWMYVFTFLPLDALRNVRLCCRIFRRAASSALASWPRWNVKVIVPALRNVGTQLGVASIGLKDPVGGNYWMMSLGVKMAYTKQSRSVVHGGTTLCLPEDHFSLLVDRTCDRLVFLHQGRIINGAVWDPPFSRRSVAIKDMEFEIVAHCPDIIITEEK